MDKEPFLSIFIKYYPFLMGEIREEFILLEVSS